MVSIPNFYLMNGDKLNKFIDLRNRIKNLKTVKCRLNHERVLIDKQTNLPISQSVPETVFERIGFCRPEIRRERISCGHTMARYILEDALTLLECEESDIQDLRNDLNETASRIHALDHEKGFAEKRLAELIEKKHFEPEHFLPEDLESAKKEITSIERQHDLCIEKIADVRTSLIIELQRVIEKSI